MTRPHDPHGEAGGLASSVGFLDQQNAAPDAQDWPAVARWRRAERERLRSERLALSVEARQVNAEALARQLTTLLSERCGDLAGQVLSGFWPIKGELDLRPWKTTLRAHGAVLALPVVETPRAPLTFRRWEQGMRMGRGPQGHPRAARSQARGSRPRSASHLSWAGPRPCIGWAMASNTSTARSPR